MKSDERYNKDITTLKGDNKMNSNEKYNEEFKKVSPSSVSTEEEYQGKEGNKEEKVEENKRTEENNQQQPSEQQEQLSEEEIFKKCKEYFSYIKEIIIALGEKSSFGLCRELQVEYQDGGYSKRVTSLEDLEKKLYYSFNEKKPFSIHWSTAVIFDDGRKINEIVIDLDEDTEKENRELLYKILNKMRDLVILEDKFFVKTSGNKGYHIFISPFIGEGVKKELLSYLRSLRRAGYKIDFHKIDSDNHMIRAPFAFNFKGKKFSEILGVEFNNRKKEDKVIVKKIPLKEQIVKILEYYKEFNDENIFYYLSEIPTPENEWYSLDYMFGKKVSHHIFRYPISFTQAVESAKEEYKKYYTYTKDKKEIERKIFIDVVVEDFKRKGNITGGVFYFFGVITDKDKETKEEKKNLFVSRIESLIRVIKDVVFPENAIKRIIVFDKNVEGLRLYKEEGEEKLFLKFKDGDYSEVDLNNVPVVFKKKIINYLKRFNLLTDFTPEYGYIIENSKKISLNIVPETCFVEVSKRGDTNYIKERIGSYCPFQEYHSFFLSEKEIGKIKRFSYDFNFFETLLEGMEESTTVKVIVGYAFACIFNRFFKDNNLLPVIPNLWIYSGISGTGKTSMLNIIRVINVLKNFEGAFTFPQVRNLLTVRSNVVIIDDIHSFGDTETRKIVKSILKSIATGNYSITTALGRQYEVRTPIAVSSNDPPRRVIEGDDALIQRFILIKAHKEIVSKEWLTKLNKLAPEVNNIMNNLIALGVYIVRRLREMGRKEDFLITFEQWKNEVHDTIKEMIEEDEEIKEKIEIGYRYDDDRFISIVSYIYIGLQLFNNIYKEFIKKGSEEKLIKEIAEFIIENNEIYRGESVRDKIIPLLIECHSFDKLKRNEELVKGLEKLIGERVGQFTSILFKRKNYYIFLKDKEIMDCLKEEVRQVVGEHKTIYDIEETLKNFGCDTSYQEHMIRRRLEYKGENDDYELTLMKNSKKFKKRVIKVPAEIIEPYLKDFDYVLFEFSKKEGEDKLKIVIKKEEEEGEERLTEEGEVEKEKEVMKIEN